MAQKFLLICLITFTGRSLQSTYRVPFTHVRSGKNRTLVSTQNHKLCALKLTGHVEAFKSFNCYKKLREKNDLGKSSNTRVIFYASRKTKPHKRGSMTYIIIPLKNWGTLYFQ